MLNKEIYFHAILKGEKIYEVRTISRLILPPRIVLHPNKTVRDLGYTQNIEAMISPFQHEKQIKTAEALLAATNNGKQLGLTEAETRALVTTAKKNKTNTVFYLYQLTEAKETQIEWLDSGVCNQSLFAKPQYTNKSTGNMVNLFQWPDTPIPASTATASGPGTLSKKRGRLADEPCSQADGKQGPIELANELQYDETLFNSLKTLRSIEDLDHLVADKYGLDITVRKIKSLLDTEWLNSEVITFWLEWWCQQIGAGSEKRMPKSSSKPKCWVANTYFYSELTKDNIYCYENIQRWTTDIDVFSLDKVIIPINENNVHWFLAVIDFQQQQTQVFDSMGACHPTVHDTLLRWLQDEHKKRKHSDFDSLIWSRLPHNVSTIPQQTNCCDCGVFMCLFAAYASLNRPFSFTQRQIPMVRRWMVQIIYKVREANQSICSGPAKRPSKK